MMISRWTYILLLSLTATISCTRDSGRGMSDDILARVGNSVLSVNEVSSRIPYGLSASDSIKFVRGYVRNWIDRKIIGEIALKNIPDNRLIDKMVDEYRMDLIMWEYSKMMYEKNLPSFLKEDSLRVYYERSQDEWITETPLIKGIFVKIPKSDSRLRDVREWYKSDKTSDIENLEKFALSETVTYDYFRNRWTSLDELNKRFPSNNSISADMSGKNNRTVEIADDNYYYLLSVSDYIPVKSKMPFEVAVDAVKDKIIGEKRLQYERDLKEELFRKSLKSGDIELNIELSTNE